MGIKLSHMVRVILLLVIISYYGCSSINNITEVKCIKFVHEGPNDLPIYDIIIVKERKSIDPYFERLVIVDEDVFSEVESYVMSNNTEIKVIDKEREFNFSVNVIGENDSTFYLLLGHDMSVGYYRDLRNRLAGSKKSKYEAVIKELDILLDRLH